jgi:glyoxylase-like metal-dependent hydrolase (beta-lactamase superfamily II)
VSRVPVPLSRDLELDALQVAVRWPDPTPAAVLALAGRFAARGRGEAAFEYFHERAEAVPSQPLFGALEAQFQLKVLPSIPPDQRQAWLESALAKLDQAVERAPGLNTLLRGLALAELPASLGKAETARVDLEWVVTSQSAPLRGFRGGAYRALGRAYASLGRTTDAQAALERSGYPSLAAVEPTILTEYSVSSQAGFRFAQARLVELAPRVYVAQGFDFGDFAFVITADRIVAIDAGTSPAHVQRAVDELRAVSDLPITDVIVTHSHWDHIGGLSVLQSAGARVIAHAEFAAELGLVNEITLPFPFFFGAERAESFEVRPDLLVSEPRTLVIGDTEFQLYPARGGETRDALLIHLPASGVTFTGDAFMPYLGAPFLPEGSADGLFETIDLLLRLSPRLLIHGHTPLTEQFTIQALPALGAALHELYERTLDGIRAGETLAQILGRNVLPDLLCADPGAVVPYLVMRENFIKRVHHQRSGYWKPDGEGMEVAAPDEWAAAVALLAGGEPRPYVDSARALLAQHDDALALRLIELGQRAFPDSIELVELRQRALQGLRALNQQFSPFKFIVYSGWARSEVPPVN